MPFCWSTVLMSNVLETRFLKFLEMKEEIVWEFHHTRIINES